MTKTKINIEEIKDPSFLKTLKRKELDSLASQIREFLIESLSHTGGHLTSNLGVIELTIGLHYVFNSPNDRFVFDVGHQTYTHKILTGRAKEFKNLRKFNGLSGYASRKESIHDIYEAGHSSTSISAISGFLCNPVGENIAIIGDASLANGLAFEGLNYLGFLKEKKAIIILNDNKMAISKSVGSMTKLLNSLRGSRLLLKIKKVVYIITPAFLMNFYRKVARGIKGFIQNNNIFEDMGFMYMGPVDGNDINSVIKILKKAKNFPKSSVVHIITQKGKGYKEADDNGDFHGVAPFDLKTGEPLVKKEENMHSWSEIISEALLKSSVDNNIKTIIPAMVNGSRLQKFQELYKDRIIDVGIAEEHATVMSCAAALTGSKVLLLMYSTFAQRAYDQFLHDIARHDVNIVIGIDRAGLAGEDGETHQGLYDVAMFNHIPNMIVSMPRTAEEAFALFKLGFETNHPFVIRYPRANYKCDLDNIKFKKIKIGWEILKKGSKLILISYGPRLNDFLEIFKDYDITIVNARFIKPLDETMLKSLFDLNIPILVIEEVVASGCLGSEILIYSSKIKKQIDIELMNVGDRFIPQGKISELLEYVGLDNDSIIKKVKEYI